MDASATTSTGSVEIEPSTSLKLAPLSPSTRVQLVRGGMLGGKDGRLYDRYCFRPIRLVRVNVISQCDFERLINSF
jgi:hypothetical protein